MTQYPTSNQEREVLALRSNGLNRPALAHDIRPRRVVDGRTLQTGEMSSIQKGKLSVSDILWLDRYGFTPVEFGGQIFY